MLIAQRRLDQPALSRMAILESMLSSGEVSEEAHEILAIYDDIDSDKLSLERRMLPNLFASDQAGEGLIRPSPDPTPPFTLSHF